MMADIRQCAFCRNLFQSVGTKTCPECTKRLDQAFLEARNYIYDHEFTSYAEILDNTEVTDKELSYLIKTDKISLTNSAGSTLKCAVCGALTASGNMCVSCAAKFAKEAKANLPKESKEPQKEIKRSNAKRMWTQRED